jgi:HEAT repeat protein
MTHLSPFQHRLTFLLSAVLLLGVDAPGFAQSRDVYSRAEQTDSDYEPERIEELIGLLKSQDRSDRTSALWDLEALGPEARRALPTLIELLDDESMAIANVGINYFAAEAFSSLQADGVAPLVKVFPEASPAAKQTIAQTAARLGTDARELLPLLRKEYASVKGTARLQSLWALALVDPTGETAFPAILIALQCAEDEYERKLAAECLRIEGSPEYGEWPSQARQWFQQRKQNPEIAVNALLQALRDKEPSVRGAAVQSLAGYTTFEKQIVPELIRLLDDDAEYSVMISNDLGGVESVSDRAADALASFPDSAETIVPAIIKMPFQRNLFVTRQEVIFAALIPHTIRPLEHLRTLLTGEHPDQALLTIARMGKAAQVLIPQVEALTKSRHKDVALQASLTLACIDSRYQAEALKQLNRQFLILSKDEDGDQEYVWNHAFVLLCEVGENADFAKPIFETVLTAPSTPELDFALDRLAAAEFLGDIGAGSTESTAAILGLMEVESWYVGEFEDTLVKMCPGIVPDLIETFGDEFSSATEKTASLRVLGAAHAENPELIPLIAAQLQSDHPAVRESVVRALGGIGTKNEQSVKALIEALGDPRVCVRAKVLDSLAKFGDKAQPAIPKIVECLADDYLTVRVATVRCLEKLGKTAAAAVDELERLKDAESLLLRETVAEALAKIRL